jgi:RNA polymerase sporulation-specific sigma factor
MEPHSVDSLHDLSDEALALKAQQESSAMNLLIERFRTMVAGMANAYAENAANAEDYAQEGLMALAAAASSYQEGQGANFRTYAAVCIRNRLRNISRKDSADQRHSVSSLDDPDRLLAEVLEDSDATPEQSFLEKERVSELFAEMTNVLSKQELDVLMLSAGALSYAEIADKLSISEKSVDNAMQRARRKLRAVRSKLS